MNAQLTSVLSAEEEKFVTTNLRKMPEYRTSAKYWLGGKTESNGVLHWVDGSTMNYVGWLPGQNPIENNAVLYSEGELCLSVQWMSSPTTILPSGLYWKSQKCASIGGYVCKRANFLPGVGINFNRIVNGTDGHIESPNYPGNYYNNLDFIVKIVGPERTRIVIKFNAIDIETQPECLYDYIQLRSVLKNKTGNHTKIICGNHEKDLGKFDFVSQSNEVELRFHSDYSIAATGFSLKWHSVDVSGCPKQTLTAKEGTIQSPNYPYNLLPQLECSYTIIAPFGKRIWLEFQHYDMRKQEEDKPIYANLLEESLEIKLGEHTSFFRPFLLDDLLTEGSFISTSEQLQVRLRTKNNPMGTGFKAIYRISSLVQEEKVINLTNITSGSVLHLNYPNNPPEKIDFTQHLIAPLGHIIALELYHLKFSEQTCPYEQGFIEIYDHYSDVNGTKWFLCQDNEDDPYFPKAPIAILSFLNTLHIRQNNGLIGTPLNGTVRVQLDVSYKEKLLKFNNYTVELCTPNPCENGGKCTSSATRKFCACQGQYTGKYLNRRYLMIYLELLRFFAN